MQMRHHFFDGGAFYRVLNFQKYLLLIEEVEEQPADNYETCIENHLTNLLRAEFCQTAEEEFIDAAEADNSLCEVDSN